MKPETRVFVTAATIVLLIAGMYIFSDWFSKTTGYALGEDQKIAFVTCLNEKSVTLYEGPNCADCEKQQAILGEKSYQLVKKIMCDADLCQGLKKVPAWEIEGVLSYGVKTFKELNELSSCNIK